MASSQSLRQYDQNRARLEDTRNMKHYGHSKDAVSSRPSTLSSASHAFKRGTENQDPLARDGKSTVRRGGISKLPVLAKTQPPQPQMDLSQVKKWEQSFLKGKAQKKRPCTKPVTFSLSERLTSRTTTGSQKKTQSTKPSAVKPQPLAGTQASASQPALPLSPKASSAAPPTTHSSPAGVQSTSLPVCPPTRQQATQMMTHLSESQTLSSASQSEHPALSTAPLCHGSDQPSQAGHFTQFSPSAEPQHSVPLSAALLSSQRNWSAQPAGTSCTSSTRPTLSSRDYWRQLETIIPSLPSSSSDPPCPVAPAVYAQESQHAPALSAKQPTVQSGHFGSISCQSNPQGGTRIDMGFTQSTYLKNPQWGKDNIQPVASTLSMHKSQRETDPISTGDGVQFSPDPAALRTILQNEGVMAERLVGATPRSSVCPTGRGTSVYLPQRVSVVKSRFGPGITAGSGVQFSPDPAALCSILQNDGMKTEEPPGATPRSSLCPTGRGTSICLPQRVPVTKGRSEAAVVTTGMMLSQTPAVKWTPQRVPNTRLQSMRRLLSSHQTPIFRGSPRVGALQSHQMELGVHKEQEDVVQRLFEEAEPEEETETDNGKDRSNCPTREGEAGEEGGGSGKEGGRKVAAQPFVPAPHRESVIVFSSSKKAIDRFTTMQGNPPPQDSESLLALSTLPEHSSMPPLVPEVQSDRPSGSDLSTATEVLQQLPCSINRLQGGTTQWIPHYPFGGPVVHRRAPPLEEVLLDEECASFTSHPPTSPARPRCGNPVASTLLLQSYTCFAPIDLPPTAPMDPQAICHHVILSA
ncbi:hypothetical protein MATL_G00101990 [Megalops atlanticus]|uniref:Uncharacterized protein n=1 Tax=Megalops atlanticus TaxID=7932 RepID=A0A9D3PYA9_MEGAT|nr:hypothetical protein MATL_G00101990 [Megalops atlanticus]